MNHRKLALLLAASTVCLAVSATGERFVIAAFPMTDDSPAASIGSEIASFSFSGDGNYSSVAPTSGFESALNQSGGWEFSGSFWELELDSTGFEEIAISAWGQRSSNTGPRDFRVDISFDGGNSFEAIVDPYTVPNTTAGYSNPGIAFAAVADNNPNIVVRWINFTNVSVNEGTVAGAGTSRFTDFEITAIPEPSVYAALFGGLALFLAVRMRRRAC